MVKQAQEKLLRWMAYKYRQYNNFLSWQRKITILQSPSFKFMEADALICSTKKLYWIFFKTNQESFRFQDWWKKMQLQQKNFWQSWTKPTTVVQPMPPLPTIHHQDHIPFAKSLSAKKTNKVEENLSWLIWPAVKELKTHRATTGNEDLKEPKLTKGTN